MRIVPFCFLTRSYFKLTPRVSEVNTECFKNKTQALTIKNHGVSRVNSRDFIKSDSYEVRLYIISLAETLPVKFPQNLTAFRRIKFPLLLVLPNCFL